MRTGLDPFSFLVVSFAGWINQRQQQLVEYLVEENGVLREQIGDRRMRFTDDQRRRLAAKAKKLGRKVLAQVATIVTPETLLAWHRKLIASASRRVKTRPKLSSVCRPFVAHFRPKPFVIFHRFPWQRIREVVCLC